MKRYQDTWQDFPPDADNLRESVCAPWTKTPFEAPLRRILIPGANEAEHTVFWNWIYGEIQRIRRDFRRPSPDEMKRAKEAEEMARQLGLPEPSAPLKSPSKQVAEMRSIAKSLRKLAGRIEPYSPQAGDLLRHLGERFACEAATFHELLRGRKRHSTHPETRRIEQLMNSVHHTTGDRHYSEISELLRLAGLNQYKPENLRELRARKR